MSNKSIFAHDSQHVKPNYELAVVVDDDGSELEVRLIYGQAEINGFDLTSREMRFPAGFRFQIFSSEGCVVQMRSALTHHKLQKNPTMKEKAEMHELLHGYRENAQQLKSVGPRLLVCGLTDTGKSSFCKFLINRAIAENFQPTFIELDASQGDITLPGCLAFSTMKEPLHPVLPYEHANPYVTHCRSNCFRSDRRSYMAQMQQLQLTFDSMMNMSQEARQSGCVINTCGLTNLNGATDDHGFACIAKAVELFKVEIIACFGNERLYNELDGNIPQEVKVVRMCGSPGIRARSTCFRQSEINSKVHGYFHGSKDNPLGYRIVISTAKLKFFAHDDSKLDTCFATELIYAKKVPLGTVVSFMHPEDPPLSVQTFRGFLRLVARNDEGGTCTFLTKDAGPIPSTNFMCMRSVELAGVVGRSEDSP